jgi:hypothetical protein
MIADYAGARGCVSISDLRRLSPKKWLIQEKQDGIYVHVHLDRAGRIERLLTRQAKPVPASLTAHLIGNVVGAPDSVLVGELDAWTEASQRATKARGWAAVTLFDALRVGGQYLAKEPYRARLDALWRSQSWAENFHSNLGYSTDATGRAHGHNGKFCSAVPRDWRLCPIVGALRGPGEVDLAWERALVGQSEGLVAVALEAPVRRRAAKVKCKPVRELDAVVLAADRRAAVLLWRESVSFTVANSGGYAVPGATVTVRHNGFYDDGTPKFARIVRERPDLV